MNNFRRRALSSSDGLNIDPNAGRKKIGTYEVVDLGLSKGLLFATWNVSGTNEVDAGNYYAWGSGSVNYFDPEGMQGHTGGTNSSYTLPSNADTATQIMGSGWRLPTKDELRDLIDKTNFTWVTNFNGSGVNGGIFISKTNPKAYVFFPAAGYKYNHNGVMGSSSWNDIGKYWSSTAYNSNNAYSLELSSTSKRTRYSDRNFGFSVRGVHAAV